jgi:DNA-binding winged helix-turn-helix (wHTH) protein/TolB-like protein/Flp pilus assembly protein TadD
MNRPTRRFYEFDAFRIDTVNRLLLRDGRPVPLKAKVVETLLLLVENHGQVLEKDAIMKALWPDTFVEEANLTQNIYVLRKALGNNSYIETIPRRGYRFAAPVKQWDETGVDLIVREQSRTSVIVEEQDEAAEVETQTQAVSAGLAKLRPGARFRRQAVAASLVLIVLAVATAYYLLRKTGANNAVGAIRSIAVLPLKPIGIAGDDEYLGLGMADALITRMSRLRHVVVRPTSAVHKYADLKTSAEQAGRELAVDAILEGTVQRSDNYVRVSVQLVRVADGSPIWAEQFDAALTNIFTLQDSISLRVTQVLALKLSSDERKFLAGSSTTNAEAYRLYLKGRYFWNKRTEEGVKKAAEYFQQAIDIDPHYAQAYNGLADCYLFGVLPLPTNELASRAKSLAKKALEFDDTLAEAHATLGLIAENFDWDWAAAETEYRRAIELNANYATAHQWYGEHLALLGRFDEALKEMKLAGELDPLSLIIIKDTGAVYYCARKYELASKYFRQALEMDPDFYIARVNLGLVYAQTGQYSAAIAELQKARQIQDGPEILSELGYVYALSGRKQEAQKILSDLSVISKRRYVSPTGWAIIYAGLGENDKALEWLEKGYRERALLTGLKVDPHYDGLRNDARFADLVRRVGLSR